MVFESYVVDLVNKFGGQFLENLDPSQLKLGIWGGDAKLENLILKESALDDFDLPIKLVRGHLGKLILKIPWKNLYSEPVVAKIDGLYLLVRPNTGIKYNAKKEAKAEQEKKERQLEAIEIARKLEEEKKAVASKKTKEESDSFIEKLAMQVVKNLQIYISNIHIRYEDEVSNPSAPFSIGITLENLSAQTTDENWKPFIADKSVRIVHKLVELNSLSVYWNTNDKIGDLPTQGEWLGMASDGIAKTINGNYKPKDFKYILQPISATSKVKLDTKPGTDLSSPKVYLGLVLEEIFVNLTKHQYHNIMELLDSFDYMSRNTPFRKYKPNVPLHKHAGKWWQYAIDSILEEDVRRRQRNWSWKHMKEHRTTCKDYKRIYKKKLLQDKLSKEEQKTLENLEEKLDVLNITICRQRAEYEEAAALRNKKRRAEEKSNEGFFSGLFGSKKKKKSKSEEPDDKQKVKKSSSSSSFKFHSKKKSKTFFQEILTEEQKQEELQKLYSAIGYSENEVVTAFPKDYVENKVIIHLRQIGVALRDVDPTSMKTKDIVRLSIQDLYADLEQRPSAQAIKVTTKLDQLKMFGSTSEQSKYLPLMITSQHGKESSLALCNAAFETNPLDEKCDQRLTVKSQPLKIVYDGYSVDKVVDFFQPPKGVQLQELSAVAISRLEELKTASKASLAYAIEHHKVTDINVDIMSPYVIIPENGRFEGASRLLVVDLGHLKITSDPDQERIVSTKDLSLSELESKCYDKFDIRLEALQVLIANKDDAWDTARNTKQSKLHVIDPVELDLKLQKALNPDDIRLAQIKISGSLHSINVHVTDKKLEQVMKLALSIPIPGSELPTDVPDAPPQEAYLDKGKRMVNIGPLSAGLLDSSPNDDDDDDDNEFSTPPEESQIESARRKAKITMSRQVQVSVKFELEKVCVSAGFEDNEGNETPCMVLSLDGLGAIVTKHQYDVYVSASIGSLAVKELGSGVDGEPVYLVQTPKDTALLSIDVIQADQESPEYYTTFLSTEKQIIIEFSSLDVLLHQEALLRFMDFSGKIMPALEENEQSIRNKGHDIKGEIKRHKSKSEIELHRKGKRKARKNPNNILMVVKAKMGGVSVLVTSTKGDIASILVGGLSADVKMLDDRTNVTASMKNLSVMDTTEGALYPKIVSIVNQEVFNVEVVVFNDAITDENYTDMEKMDTSFKMEIGCIKVIFLNRVTMELLAFLNNFQNAKVAMQQATISASEQAAIKMQDIQEQASRIKLEVSIQAPLIIIPVSSSSRNVLIADLGRLNVSNSFKLHKQGTKTDGSDAVIVDNMVVDLSSVKLSRGSITKDEKLQTSSVIIEPMSMTVYLTRNLSPWFHEIPDVNVHGKLRAVELCTGEEDLATILAVVFQNLAEGPEQPQIEELEEIETADGTIVPLTDDSLESAPKKEESKDTVWETLKFSFEIEEVSASVYWKEADKPSKERDPSCCLGKFSIVSVKTNGRMTSNMALDAVVTLETCVLDDKRPESVDGVTRMMERFQGGESREVPNMIDVKYEQSPNQDQNISIDVNNVHIIANLEFILVLANVFTKAMGTGPQQPAVDTNQSDITQALDVTAAMPVPQGNKEPPSMRLQFALRQPEIVLLADAKDKDTHALFMKNTIDFNMMFANGQQKMFAHLSNLSITSAAFDKEQRDATKTQVFYLAQLAMHSSAPEGQSMHVDIRTSVANIHVSPPTIRTITACLMSLTQTQDTGEDRKQSIADNTMWTENVINTKKKWYLAPVPQDQVSPGLRIYGRWPKNNKYYPGYVAKIDVRVKLKFDNGDEVLHDVNDLTAVVLDQTPDEKDLKEGTKVLAPDQKTNQYLSLAVIKKIEKKDDKLVYNVDYVEGKEGSFGSHQLRKLTLIKPGASEHDIVPSSIVFVQIQNSKYVHGFVSSRRQRLFVVKPYQAQGHPVKVNVNNLKAAVLDHVPQPTNIHVGMTVIGKGKNSEYWHLGKVYQIKKEEEMMKFNVIFDGENEMWLDVEDIRIVPRKRHDVPEGSIDVGSSVWAWWKGITYNPGYISYKGNKLHVDFYDGQKRNYDIKDALVNVLPDVVQNVRDVHQGARVISSYKNSKCRLSGVIDSVDKSREKFKFYHVKFDNGDDDWVRLYDLQFLPKEGSHTETSEKSPSKGKVPSPDHTKTMKSKLGEWELIEDEEKPFKSVFSKEKKALVKSDSKEGDLEMDRGEMMLFNMEGFDVIMEGMYGGQIVPLLSMNGHVQAEVKDWTSKLEVTAGVSVIANYFNENISEWEPLIEPVEESAQKYRQWELNMEFSMGDSDNTNGDEAGGGLDVNLEPEMSLDIESKDDMQITVTKTSLDVFYKLADAFGEAVALESTDKIAIEDLSPYIIRNELGLGIKVYLGNSLKASHSDEQSATTFPVATGKDLPMYLTAEANRQAMQRVRSADDSGISVSIEVEGYHTTKDIPVKQARVAFYTLVPRQLLRGTMMAMVVQVESSEGQKVVTIRSPLQIYNHFPIPLDLSCQKESASTRIATIPAQSIYNVPIVLAYRAALHLKPSGFPYSDTDAPMVWTQLKTANGARFVCNSQIPGEPPFFIQVLCERAKYTFAQGIQDSSPVYTYHVHPAAILHNYLPYDISYCSAGIPSVNLKGGDNSALYAVDLTNHVPLSIKIDNYLGESWRGSVALHKGMDELSVFTLSPVAEDSAQKPVELGVFTQMDGALNVTLYCPYWMVNKTGMFLEYRASDGGTPVGHPDSHSDAVMFSYKGKGNSFSKKTATKIRLSGSEWSNKFSLDAVGSGGSMKIIRQAKEVEIGIQISLSYFSLTKIVEFTPFHLLKNQLSSTVHICEAPDDDYLVWTKVQPGECVPYWPSKVPPENLVIRVGDDMDNSPRFNFQPETTVLLRMSDKIGAVCVEMVGKDSAAIMTFVPYYDGAAAVRLENCTPLKIHYKQDCKDSHEYVLNSGHSILYTWDKKMEKKAFVWWAEGEADKKRTTDLTEASHSSFVINGSTFYWATFLDGLQRVLLIIDDFTLAYRAQLEIPERISQSIKLELHGFGLSLVNNESSIELAYIGITKSDVVWEEMKSKTRWKGLKLGLSEQLEECWNHVQHVNSVGGEPNYRNKIGDIEVDFELMEIIKPYKRPIRRTFTPAVSILYETSPHELRLHTKVNSVQIDSQIPGSTFRTVLHPVAPPKSVAADNAPKPFFEMSLVMRQVEHSQVNEIKYFKVLIQEMEVMVDMGFIMALVELFSSNAIDRSKELSQYTADKQRVLDSLCDANAVQAALGNKRNYFDNFHLSPLKIHLSFSQLGGSSSEEKEKSHKHIGNSFVHLLMQSVGVAVTEVQDVEFKLAYFEINNQVYDQQQLIDVIRKHYTSQAIKQMYVLVLGLDVLGNPFGLISGLKDGAKDLFYEPYQGFIQGPGEFAEGLALGVRSLVGHTVGGAAGAVSRITGTLGKGIAALTMDEKYQNERRQAMGKKPVNVGEGLARGGKGLFEGVFDGVTGIVTKPVEGAKQQGAAGFFKGVGKGLVGVVARPAGGIVDFASSTFEGIKGTADNQAALQPLRPPRVFYADKVMKPYNLYEATGNHILQCVQAHASGLAGDLYFAHRDLNIKKTLLLTNKHIIVAGKTEVFQNWECDWSCALADLTAEPTTDKNKLVLSVPDKGRVLFKKSEQRTITTPTPQIAQWFVKKIKEVMS